MMTVARRERGAGRDARGDGRGRRDVRHDAGVCGRGGIGGRRRGRARPAVRANE